jgi:lipopolysaccharide transport system ATP-binding protein
MAETRVVFDHVWKKFRRGERHDSLRDLLPSLVRRMVQTPHPETLNQQEFWAVKDVSFEVKEGCALGIIGPNGAGKSTTLKLLTKILRPTMGKFIVRGRVGALIEIAAGFHPDLTGRENVFLQGAIMGMRREEIRRKMEEIIEFAGVGAFIDTPVKRYSSGMNARLGFSIAAHLDPDVLIIDEVLSVGDMAFQERCIRRMEQFKRQGVAIVFVSHNLQAVASLCDQALFLKGECRAIGQTSEVLQTYLESSLVAESSDSGSEVEILEARLTDASGHAISSAVRPGTPLALRVSYLVREPVEDLILGLLCYRSTDMLVVYDGNFHDREVGFSKVSPGSTVTIDFKFHAHLTRGQYHLACHVTHPTQRVLSRLSPAAMLTVEEERTYAGVADLAVNADVRGVDEPGTAAAPVRGDGLAVGPAVPAR